MGIVLNWHDDMKEVPIHGHIYKPKYHNLQVNRESRFSRVHRTVLDRQSAHNLIKPKGLSMMSDVIINEGGNEIIRVIITRLKT